MELINDTLIDQVLVKAQESPRLRMNYNLHEVLEDPVQRLLNVFEVGTMLPIHCHRDTAETYVVLRGRLRVMFYDEQGVETESVILDPTQGEYGIHMPARQWHTIEVLESGTTIFEVKQGPYRPLDPDELLGR